MTKTLKRSVVLVLCAIWAGIALAAEPDGSESPEEWCLGSRHRVQEQIKIGPEGRARLLLNAAYQRNIACAVDDALIACKQRASLLRLLSDEIHMVEAGYTPAQINAACIAQTPRAVRQRYLESCQEWTGLSPTAIAQTCTKRAAAIERLWDRLDAEERCRGEAIACQSQKAK